MAEIHTPSRIVGTPSRSKYANILDMDDMDMTLNEIHSGNKNKMDVIATNVNKTIQELNSVYNEIGYPKTEISLKKAEIFSIIEDTIQNFTSNLKREKLNIESECQWLRQEIKIILAMINDSKGARHLSNMNKGIVFEDLSLYEEGFKDEIQRKLCTIRNRKENFYEDSPFNVTNNTSNIMEEISFEKRYEEMLDQVPKLTLVKLRKELNSIFLDIMKIFMKSFKKLNTNNLILLELVETIGNADITIKKQLDVLPAREDAEYHKELIDLFEATMKFLRLYDLKASSFSKFNDDTSEEFVFIVASPRKSKVKDINVNEDETNKMSGTSEELMGHLREINYKTIKSIRSLKITKITPELISDLHKLISRCEEEVEKRKEIMQSVIKQIFELVDMLGYNEEQLISLQKQYNEREKERSSDSINDTYFDIETLNFILMNPIQFGLNDNHLKFIENFLQLLQKVKDNKQKKWEYYVARCKSLWAKLGESDDHAEYFFDSNNTLTDSSLSNWKHELNRLLSERSKCIDTFIMDTRAEIEKFWEKLYYTDEEKLKFKYFDYELNPNDSYDKEMILNEHEEELNTLKGEFESKSPILNDYEELKQLLKDQEFLVESSKDSARLLSKNSCKILLNEERIRKRILKNMPKLIQNLKSTIASYNSVHEQPLYLKGTDFLERILAIEVEQLNRRKTNNNNRSVSTSQPRGVRNKGPTSSVVSPLKSSQRPSQNPSRRTSPVKIAGKSLHPRQSPLASTSTLRKPPIKIARTNPNPNPNPRTNKIISSINNSICESTHSSHSGGSNNSGLVGQVGHISTFSQTSSQVSPYMIDKRSGNNSLLKSLGTHLQPLNSPLIPEYKSGSKASPSLSRMSPLRINNNFSSIHEEDKENSNLQAKAQPDEMTLNITPIKGRGVGKWDKNTSTPASESRSIGDSSNIGDEYLQWRLEKLRQLNNA